MTFNILKALRNIEYYNFIFTSSSEIYGNNQSPFIETQIPEFLGDGVLSVRVNTQTMTTGDSWLVSNGIKNGLDSEIKPLVEKDFFEWNFDYGTNFFGFKVNDPEIL